jgi:hypothetical protein
MTKQKEKENNKRTKNLDIRELHEGEGKFSSSRFKEKSKVNDIVNGRQVYMGIFRLVKET